MRFGLYGGTFDPIHYGHLDVAHAACTALGLERVSFVPARVPPHRRVPRASAADRFAMVSVAVHGTPSFLASDLEMADETPAYTQATLDRLEARGETLRDWVVILGADAFLDIGTWKGYPSFLDRCAFAVVSRPGRPVVRLPGALPALSDRMIEMPIGPSGGTTARPLVTSTETTKPDIFLVDAPTRPVSSTDVRARRAAGASIAGLVPVAVEEYIQTHDLYVESI